MRGSPGDSKNRIYSIKFRNEEIVADPTKYEDYLKTIKELSKVDPKTLLIEDEPDRMKYVRDLVFSHYDGEDFTINLGNPGNARRNLVVL